MPAPEVQLLGRWVHSSEDDHDGVAVYRRPEFNFPPARGRRGLEFGADGSFVEWAIGRGDGSEARPGRWEPDPAGGAVARGAVGGTALRAVQTAPDVLEVRAVDTPAGGPT
ncbi:hypothetical protein [Pengzhenrongella sicca]|uniref:Uncharacterized protein n=1 Tax=Pengzhenrongella sicca TaxID=2819238 RepID=A0A8A4ZG20_9MICO|nr:hypothetical protein [Pengzhenrongella sicca]QTE30844.1 hypothetical protein J4E96_07920 [Pengzhenrongella sicca]